MSFAILFEVDAVHIMSFAGFVTFAAFVFDISTRARVDRPDHLSSSLPVIRRNIITYPSMSMPIEMTHTHLSNPPLSSGSFASIMP